MLLDKLFSARCLADIKLNSVMSTLDRRFITFGGQDLGVSRDLLEPKRGLSG